MRRAGKRTSRGFTLVEVVVATTVLMVMAGSLITAMQGMRGLTDAGNLEVKLQEAGERALSRMVEDLRRSGFVEVDLGGGPPLQSFPYIFKDGDPTLGWTWGIDPTGANPDNTDPPVTNMGVHAHAPAAKAAQPGDPDFGPNQEIVFVIPADADLDGVPDIDASGDIVWSPNQISYVLVTRLDGVNYVERRVNGVNNQKVAMNVERLVFDDNTSSGGGAVRVNTIRIEIHFRQVDSQGLVHRYVAQTSLRLRNARESE